MFQFFLSRYQTLVRVEVRNCTSSSFSIFQHEWNINEILENDLQNEFIDIFSTSKGYLDNQKKST
jgi:hypothetical protein